MKTPLSTFRRLALAGAAAFLLAAGAGRAHAAFILTLTQSGGNVVVNGSGTLNTTALSPGGSFTASGTMQASIGVLYAGPANTLANFYTGVTGPGSFGNGGNTPASTGGGNFVGIYGSSGFLITPSGYVSGTPLTNTETFNNRTFATIGFTPGTYTYTWGAGANADSLTVTSAVPEPGTWAFVAAGAAGLGVMLRRRRRA